MIKNFFTVAIRNFLRHKFYSFINLFGLASGLVCALFIYLWVNDELSKDKFHNDSDRIFQVVSNLQFNEGETLTWTITPGPLADFIRDNFPEVQMAVREIVEKVAWEVIPELAENIIKRELEKVMKQLEANS